MNIRRPLLLAAAVALAAVLAAPAADAQRRDKEDKDAPKALYPDATREEPEGSFSVPPL